MCAYQNTIPDAVTNTPKHIAKYNGNNHAYEAENPDYDLDHPQHFRPNMAKRDLRLLWLVVHRCWWRCRHLSNLFSEFQYNVWKRNLVLITSEISRLRAILRMFLYCIIWVSSLILVAFKSCQSIVALSTSPLLGNCGARFGK